MWLHMHDVLKWMHILAMVYWLGGEWGVFNASRFVTDSSLSREERGRHMETAYRIDILARTGIIMLLPLGLHMGYDLKVQPLGGPWIIGMWILTAGWLALLYSAYLRRDTDVGLRLTRYDEGIRFVVIPLLLSIGLVSLVTGGPLTARWYAVKVTLFGLLLVIGLVLRYIMRNWVTLFRSIAAVAAQEAAEEEAAAIGGGPASEVGSEGGGVTLTLVHQRLVDQRTALEAKISREIFTARRLAYIYWAGIATVCFFGVTKPPM